MTSKPEFCEICGAEILEEEMLENDAALCPDCILDEFAKIEQDQLEEIEDMLSGEWP